MASLANVPESGRLILAVSGGVDSMVMLEGFRRLPQLAPRVLVLHFNHGLRGVESEADEAFVRAAAKKAGFAFRLERFTWEGRPSQNDCRKRREEAYRAIRNENDRVFLAHHLDDQAETLLLRLVRGTGVRGLAGMEASGGGKIRPFLSLSREELLAAASEWKVKWREDSSNRSARYERNWVRLELLPLLEKRRPGLNKRLAALAEEVRALRASPPKPDAFRLGKSTFFRLADLKKLSASELNGLFRLSRLHTRGLEALLKKGNGSYSAEGIRFRLSQGVLLAESGENFEAPLLCSSSKAESVLGKWRSTGPAGLPIAPATGAKKQFQAARVPLFFRSGILLVRQRGAARPALGASDTVDFQPSPLGAWWLSSLAKSDGPAAGISR